MAAMESSYMLKHNKRGVSFSEMNLFNCMHKDGVYTDKSCHNGGDVAAVYQAARDHGLVLTKDDEPYMSKISRTDSNFTFVVGSSSVLEGKNLRFTVFLVLDSLSFYFSSNRSTATSSRW